ncbi:LysR family transcriptional regulator [Sphingomonadaceae bacterium G21617-S1]|nr:LysR family transcriptional regulator [Sphingomonadaceae bacterium G21617-S1]
MVNVRTFDLNLLRVFEAIVNDNSVSKAADKLGMSQPAVSNALNRLRRQLDDPLFVRTPMGMDPTPKARELAISIGGGLTAIRAGLLAGMAFDPATSERQFTLLMTDVGQINFLPPLLSVLNREAPHIDIHVMEAGVETYGDLLESGIADLAVGRISLSDKFESEMIHSSPFVVLMGKQNRLLKGRSGENLSISKEEYLDARHVSVLPRGSSADPIPVALGADSRRRKIALKVPHATVLPMIIRDTELLATIPKIAAHNLLTPGTLQAVPVPFAIEPNRVYQWWHRRNTADAGHRWLRHILASAGV